jgi:CheY-like chemotaxis protein
MLKMLGQEAVPAVSGEEAVALYASAFAENKPFDLVILDLTVRGSMGGKQALEELRKINPTLRAVASSGYSNDPVMSDARQYGFSATLKKPYTLSDLADLLNALL